MIVAKLMGGLGNQMFQYATGRFLSEKYGWPLLLDIEWYRHQELRRYTLDCFNIRENLFTNFHKSKFNNYGFNQSEICIAKILRKVGLGGIANFFNERSLVITEKNEDLILSPEVSEFDSIYITGDLQNHKYFEEIRNILLFEYTPRYQPSVEFKSSINKLQNTNSVSIHLRFGDYLHDVITSKTHGALSIEYYKKGIDYIKSRIKNPVFYVFSDDVIKAKEFMDSIETNYEILSTNKASHAFEDLTLMSKCKHNIIANSTYSWWSAWLNSNDSKIIVSPKNWFKKTKINPNLIPPSWIQI